MILLLDYRNDGNRIGLIDAEKERWIEGGGERSGFPALAKALSASARKPTMVAVTVHQKASWSTMRASVAAANALAFAWNVPVRGIAVTGDEPEGQLAAQARTAAAGSQAGRWAYPAYGGEPNITVAKNAL